MSTALPSTILTCTQCGGELHPDEGQIFLTCPYCSATVYVDKARVVFHWSLRPTVDDERARGELARWMAGNQTVKDLDKKARITYQTFRYFPMWFIRRGTPEHEQVTLLPAAATSITELRNLKLQAGDLVKYDPALEAQCEPPSVPLEAVLTWSKQFFDNDPVMETALVHIPIYTFKYAYQNQMYTAVVEGATGATLANVYPAKAEAPYRTAGLLTAGVYLALAVLLMIFIAADNTGLGLALCGGLGLLAAPFLFGFAAWVAAKV